MTRALRFGLLVAGALAACLAVLWACVVLGLWLALHPVTGLARLTGAVVIVVWLFVLATRLLAALTDHERQR